MTIKGNVDTERSIIMKKLIILMISFIIFFSCDNSVGKKESDIVINLSFSNASYSNINTSDTEVNRLLFEGLTKENEKGEIVAGLAQRWEISQDYKKITFYLRDNLKYSNGMPMTSEDFLRTISKWKNSKSFYENKYLIIKAVNDKILEKMKKTMKKLMLLNLKIREKLRYLKVEKDTEENKIKMLTEMDRILAEKILFLLIDDDVYRYYLVNPKLKGVRVGDYGNFFLSETYIEK